MNTSFTTKRRHRGFTLIELLVVIAIIATLAAMAFSVGAGTIKKARMLADTNTATALSQAIDYYYDDYGRLPEIGTGGTDTTTESTAALMNILLAVGPDGERQNPSGVRYFAGTQARGTTSGNAYRGLFYTGSSSVELFDAWKKSAPLKRHFQIVMDTNFDGEIANPISSGDTLHGMRAVVWSTGQDGADATSSRNDPKNRDNSYSW